MRIIKKIQNGKFQVELAEELGYTKATATNTWYKGRKVVGKYLPSIEKLLTEVYELDNVG